MFSLRSKMCPVIVYQIVSILILYAMHASQVPSYMSHRAKFVHTRNDDQFNFRNLRYSNFTGVGCRRRCGSNMFSHLPQRVFFFFFENHFLVYVTSYHILILIGNGGAVTDESHYCCLAIHCGEKIIRVRF